MAKKCIPGVICFENITIAIIILILLLVIIYIYKFTNITNVTNYTNATNDTTMMPSYNTMPINNRGFVFNNSVSPPLPTRMSDTLLDPYQPPLRDNFNYFMGGGGMIPINIPTQAPPMTRMMMPPPPPMLAQDNYQQVGLLTRANGSEMILPLMGQSLYSNRDKWNYYTMSDKNNIVKLPINYRGKSCMNEYGCDSLNSGDHVHVEGYNDKFKVTIYDNKLMRYLPMF